MGILNRTVNNLFNSDSSNILNWNKNTPIPNGFKQQELILTFPIQSNFNLNLTCIKGNFCQGSLNLHQNLATSTNSISTILNEEQGDLPSYSKVDSNPNSEFESGEIKIILLARFNLNELWEETKFELIKDEDNSLECGFNLETPTSPDSTSPLSLITKRFGSIISYNITLLIPNQLNSLNSFKINLNNFKIQSNKFNDLSNLFFNSILIYNTNAPINLNLNGNSILIENKNILNPIIGQVLKHNEILIKGSYFARKTLIIKGENGEISGDFTALEELNLNTTNGNINGIFQSSLITISNLNATISGEFLAYDKLIIHNQNGQISGKFEGKKNGILITNKNSSIVGSFTIGKGGLNLATNDFKIDAIITLLPCENEENELAFQASRERKSSSSSSHSSSSASLPSGLSGGLSPLSSSSLPPPTFEEIARNSLERRISAGETRNRIKCRTKVLIETTNASIKVIYKHHPYNVLLSSIIKSSGGGKVSVTHPSNFVGNFIAITSLLSEAQLSLAPPAESSSGKAKEPTRRITYSTKKRNELAGIIHDDQGEEEIGSKEVVDAGRKGKEVLEQEENDMNKTMVGTSSGMAEINIL